ncbi:hypothetical protein QFC20_003238 [Naganishia adeliensis]|uniref:Uncharacterized protein n=1 Tax=Naganishia adeliensis TaxID=92952 RepID=A0ACC2WDT3_9TREE|nr:hypothetical protein QFC20_003238 [Naganishia adeliensis]
MGNTDTLKITKGKDKIKEYRAVLEFNKDGTPKTRSGGTRSFCSECSSMLWNYDEEWAHWIYPFASVIDSPNPLPSIPGYPQFTMSSTDTATGGARVGSSDEVDKPQLYVLKRNSCPAHVPAPCNSVVYGEYPPGEGIEAWHKATGTWVD